MGTGIGLTIGMLSDNPLMGLAIGMAFGLAMGTAFGTAKARRQSGDGPSDSEE
jgi:hypothetical protein